MTTISLKVLLDALPGTLSEDDAFSLYRAARFVQDGALVNIGPCDDKAAIALAVGLASYPPNARQKYYCIEPQRDPAKGARVLLSHKLAKLGCERLADLIITPGAVDLADWSQPVSVLRLQTADYVSMRAELDRWLPRLTPSASIVIQGPNVDKSGRRRLLAELESAEKFILLKNGTNLFVLRRIDGSSKTSFTGASTVEILRQYAQAGGESEESLKSRLTHSSFVSRGHRYVYIEVPKAACTTMKYFIAELERAPCQLDRMPYLRETKRSMFIHQRQYFCMPTLLDLQATELHALLSGQTDYFIFALVRNPYSRLVSSFESKVRLSEPGLRERFGRHWSALTAGADVREAFAAFVRTDLEKLVSEEHHFISQNSLLVRSVIPYTKIFPVERFSEFEAIFLTHLRRYRTDDPIPGIKDWNRSNYPDWRNYYDQPTAERVLQLFEADFECFGYDPESWRTDEVRDLHTTPTEAYWRTEVIERNEMIDFLYGQLRNAK